MTAILLVLAATIVHAQDPLPSWNDSSRKQAIMTFVKSITRQSFHRELVMPAQRIATFDNDGTLWAEVFL